MFFFLQVSVDSKFKSHHPLDFAPFLPDSCEVSTHLHLDLAISQVKHVVHLSGYRWPQELPFQNIMVGLIMLKVLTWRIGVENKLWANHLKSPKHPLARQFGVMTSKRQKSRSRYRIQLVAVTLLHKAQSWTTTFFIWQHDLQIIGFLIFAVASISLFFFQNWSRVPTHLFHQAADQWQFGDGVFQLLVDGPEERLEGLQALVVTGHQTGGRPGNLAMKWSPKITGSKMTLLSVRMWGEPRPAKQMLAYLLFGERS